MLGTRKRGIAALAAAAATVGTLAFAGPTGAASTSCGGAGGGGIGPAATGGTGITQQRHRRTCTTAGYVNPIRGAAWLPGRTDMGVDFSVTRHKPIVAIGDALVLGSDNNSGWPGGHLMWYRLLDGDHAGNIIYVAETMGRMLPAGTTVTAGERIATAMPGGTGTEWGWANKLGSPRAAPCYSEGMKTNSGKEFARFLRHLGAKTADKPGPGPDFPSGDRC